MGCRSYSCLVQGLAYGKHSEREEDYSNLFQIRIEPFVGERFYLTDCMKKVLCSCMRDHLRY